MLWCWNINVYWLDSIYLGYMWYLFYFVDASGLNFRGTQSHWRRWVQTDDWYGVIPLASRCHFTWERVNRNQNTFNHHILHTLCNGSYCKWVLSKKILLARNDGFFGIKTTIQQTGRETMHCQIDSGTFCWQSMLQIQIPNYLCNTVKISYGVQIVNLFPLMTV